MKKIIIASVASLAMAAMPMVGVFADTTVLTDTLEITVSPTCTFSQTTEWYGGQEVEGQVSDNTYSATATNNSIVSFGLSEEDAQHTFGIWCNDGGGWKVTASAPLNLTATGVTGHAISYGDHSLPDDLMFNPEVEGMWNVAASGDQSGGAGVTDGYISSSGGVIAQGASIYGGNFTVTYGAYVGLNTPAGTYTAATSTGHGNTHGTIDYTLQAL